MIRLLENHPTHYRLHDGKAEFRVPKAGLSKQLHERIQRLAGGGEVRAAVTKTVAGGGAPRQLTDVMHAKAPMETAEEKAARKKAERAEETGEGYADGGPVWEPPDYSGTRLPAAAAQEIETQLEQPSAAGVLPTSMYAAMVAPGSPAGAPMDLEARQGGNLLAPAARALSTIPGLRLSEQPNPAPAPEAPAPAAAPAAPRAARAGMAPTGSKEFADATRAEQAAVAAKGEAESQAALSTAKALSDQRAQLQALAIEEREKGARARESASEMMGQYKQQLDEMRKVDTAVDPGRFWASKTTGQKVLGIIGLALGAVGAGKDGVNRAAQMLSTAIDRDIEAQKAETEARLRKGSAALSATQQMYAMNRQLFQDDLAATAASKVSALELADNQLKQVAATAASPIAKAQAAALSAQLGQAKAKFDSELQGRLAELGIKREALRIEELKAGATAAGKNRELQDAKASAQTALDTIASIRAKLGATRVIGSAAPLGTQTLVTGAAQKVGPVAAGLEGDTANLVTQLKDAERLGAISSGDYELLMKQIGDPTEFWAFEGSKDAKIDALEARVRGAIKNRRAAAGEKVE